MMESSRSLDELDALLDDLTKDLMAYWWQANTRALVQTVGSLEAVNRLRPYWEHGGRAAAHNLRKMTGVESLDAGSVASLWALPRYGSNYGVDVRSNGGSSRTTIQGCSIYSLGQNDEICQCMCVYAGNACIKELNPEFELDLVRSRAFGDADCCWIVKRKGSIEPNEGEGSYEIIPPPRVINQMFGDLALAYVGQFWIDSTNAFIESLGRERTSEILEPLMRNLGKEFGSRIIEELKLDMDQIETLMRVVERIEKFILREGRIAINSSGMIEKEITYCPLANSPVEICDQYESFINGICDTLAPSYEFVYQKRTTNGDISCHWTIRKKRDTPNERMIERITSDDPARTLALRYANGEITEDELEAKLNTLRRQGLIS